MAPLNSSILDCHVQCARWLIARGADVNLRHQNGSCPLHYASFPGDCSSSAVSLLLKAGARVNVRTENEDLTPLGQLVERFDYDLEEVEEDEIAARQAQICRSGLEIMISLLRAGASLDRCRGTSRRKIVCKRFYLRTKIMPTTSPSPRAENSSPASARTALTRRMCGSRIASSSACALCSYAVALRRTANASSASLASRTAPAGTCSRTSGKLRD